MTALRVAVAKEAGFSSFVDYAFRHRERFDYGVEATIRFHEAIERIVVPLCRQIQEERLRTLGVETLRPWDLAVDPLGRSPLRPFTDVDTLAVGTEAIFTNVDAELGRQFAYLRTNGLLDLANRKGKAPGGYQTTLEDDRLPFSGSMTGKLPTWREAELVTGAISRQLNERNDEQKSHLRLTTLAPRQSLSGMIKSPRRGMRPYRSPGE